MLLKKWLGPFQGTKLDTNKQINNQTNKQTKTKTNKNKLFRNSKASCLSEEARTSLVKQKAWVDLSGSPGYQRWMPCSWKMAVEKRQKKWTDKIRFGQHCTATILYCLCLNNLNLNNVYLQNIGKHNAMYNKMFMSLYTVYFCGVSFKVSFLLIEKSNETAKFPLFHLANSTLRLLWPGS